MKQMKRGFALLLALLLLLAALTACGGSAGGDSAASDSGGASSNSASGGSGGTSFQESEDIKGYVEFTTDAETAAPMEPNAAAPEESGTAEAQPVGEKLIYTATLEVETTDFDTADQALAQLTESMGGYFENRSTNDYGSYRHGNYTIRVPSEHYSAFLNQVGQFCHVRHSDQSVENVSEAYYDIEARLTTQRTKLARLQELLGQAEDMADIITIESAISETELEIEYLTGSLRGYDNRINYSTVHVYLDEVYKLSSDDQPVNTFGQRVGNAFTGGLRSFVDFLEDSVVFVARNWIALLFFAAVVVVVVTALRRKLRKGAPPPSDGNPPANPPA